MKQISNFYTDSPALTLTIQDIKKLFFSLSLPKLSSFSNITVDGIFFRVESEAMHLLRILKSYIHFL